MILQPDRFPDNSILIPMGFWSRHKRKIFIGLGAIGGGYVVYRLWDFHKTNVERLQRQSERDKQDEEIMKLQILSHFENVQRISDTTTLPYVMQELRSRILEKLDLSELREKLIQAKAQPGFLSPHDRIQIWDRIKILSFTRTAAALWAVTMLSLYVRVQVNILGRHLVLDIARNTEEESESTSNRGQLEFLRTADFLPAHGINSLLTNMETAATEILKEKQLNDQLSTADLHATITAILNQFMQREASRSGHWTGYLVPQNASVYRELAAPDEESEELMDTSRLEVLMSQTRTVLSSPDFGTIMEMAMKKVVRLLIEELSCQVSSTAPIALVKLLPYVSQMSIPLLEEPDNNKFISDLCNIHEIQEFYTAIYTDMTLS